MARQRFIWPTIWTDKRFGELDAEGQVMFVALFSLADDEGRIVADPKYLRSQIFPYKEISVSDVEAIRDRVVAAMPSVHMYQPRDEPLIALLKWSDYQHPKYAKQSKLPPPLTEDSPNVVPIIPHRVGLDRDGLGGAVNEEINVVPIESVKPPLEPHEEVQEQIKASLTERK